MRIKVGCKLCGIAHQLRPGDVTLHLPYRDAVKGQYAFTCPSYDILVVVPVARKGIAELMFAQVATVVAGDPPWDRPDLPPLTMDDLLDLMLELRNDETFLRQMIGP